MNTHTCSSRMRSHACMRTAPSPTAACAASCPNHLPVSSHLRQGFVVSPTHESCTRGLWVWSVPVPVNGPGGKVNVVSSRVGHAVWGGGF